MFYKKPSMSGQHHSRMLRRWSVRHFALSLLVFMSYLMCTAIGLSAAGDGPIPIVEVKLTEFAIEMPLTVPIGPVTFSVTNAGTMAHNFEVEGEGLERKFEMNLKPGESKNLQVDLPAGTYTVYCPLDDHKERNMRVELKVAQQRSE